MIEDQLDTLIQQSAAQITRLDTIIGLLQGGDPIPIPPDPPLPGHETLLFKQVLWPPDSIGDTADKSWKGYDRPHENTFTANLSYVLNKLRFNKQAIQAAGYGSSVVARKFAAPYYLRKLRVVANITYLDNWKVSNGCKHAFWSGTQNGTNHCFASFNNYDGKIRPSVLLQSPFFNYYCDFVVEKMVPYDFEWTADFENKTLEMKVNGIARLINSKAWIKPDVMKVENVNYGFDSLEFKQFQFDPTEPACPADVPIMSHEYGQLEVYGVLV